MSEYILGALTMLIGCVVGYVMGVMRPYLDRWVSKRLSKPKPPQQGGTTA